jgi:hypothetical protein
MIGTGEYSLLISLVERKSSRAIRTVLRRIIVP